MDFRKTSHHTRLMRKNISLPGKLVALWGLSLTEVVLTEFALGKCALVMSALAMSAVAESTLDMFTKAKSARVL